MQVRVRAFARLREALGGDLIRQIGGLRVGENTFLIVIGAGHQKEVFDVCEYILERIKESVPIWKKEIGEGGEHWVAGRVARKRRVIQRRGSPAS